MALTINDDQVGGKLTELAEIGLEVMILAGMARDWDDYLLDELVDRLTQGAREVELPDLSDRGAWESLARD